MFANSFPPRQVGVDAHVSTMQGPGSEHFPHHELYFLTHSTIAEASQRTSDTMFLLGCWYPSSSTSCWPPPWQGLWHLRAKKGSIFQPSIFFVACGQSHEWVSEESLSSQLLPGHQQERQLTGSRMLDLWLLCGMKPGSKCQYNCSELPTDRRKSSPLHQPFCKGFAILLWVRKKI